jgi:H+/gluconate symporter-like permease
MAAPDPVLIAVSAGSEVLLSNEPVAAAAGPAVLTAATAPPSTAPTAAAPAFPSNLRRSTVAGVAMSGGSIGLTVVGAAGGAGLRSSRTSVSRASMRSSASVRARRRSRSSGALIGSSVQR